MIKKPKIELFSDFGTSEPWVARVELGLPEILQATNFPNKDKVAEAILGMGLECLSPAFVSLREIKNDTNSSGKKKPVVENQKNYKDLYGYLWKAYRDRMNKIAQLMNFDISFLYANDKDFEKGIQKFSHPNIDSGFIEMLRNERVVWQNSLSHIRNNFIEHNKIPESDIKNFLNIESATMFFNNCWQAIEEILIILIRTGLLLDKGIDIAEISEDKRDQKCPVRYKLIIKKV